MSLSLRLRALLLSCTLLSAGPAAAAPVDAPSGAGATVIPVPSGTAGFTGPAEADRGIDGAVSRAAKGWFRSQWAAYRASFVSPDGRVVDNANGGVSHSEGQGYGLLLALAADDPDGFAAIWRWTSDHLGVRHDGLFAWKWEPGRNAVADQNNAADGDVLIAWALAKAARRFDHADYGVEARRIADAVAAAAVRPSALGPVLLPAAAGFGPADQPGGPVVNPSYWIFPAFRDFAALWPKSPWGGLRASGFKLLGAARFGPLGLPADWISIGDGKPAPAHGFPAAFGYDAIRIPLYLAWDGDAPSSLLSAFARFSPASDPSVIDVLTGSSGPSMGGVGYRAIFALGRCAAWGETVPPDLMTARDTLYYPETLRLLSLYIIQERYPRCL